MRQLLARAVRRAKGRFFARWRDYLKRRRSKHAKTTAAAALHRNLTKHLAFMQWADAATAAAAVSEAKLATALEFAFGNAAGLLLANWRAVVAASTHKRIAMRHLVALLAGFALENVGTHALAAWRTAVSETHKDAIHLRKATSHYRSRVLDQVTQP